MERYVALNGKYLEDADKLLTAGDYVQASEKYWGAVATMIKAVAEQRNLRHFNHSALGHVVGELRLVTGDDEYVSLFKASERLHANFYDNFLDAEAVTALALGATRLIEKLKATLVGAT